MSSVQCPVSSIPVSIVTVLYTTKNQHKSIDTKQRYLDKIQSTKFKIRLMKNITQKVSEQNEYRVKQNQKTTILNIIKHIFQTNVQNSKSVQCQKN